MAVYEYSQACAFRLTRGQRLLQASSTKSAVIDRLTRQPTMQRAYTSITKATTSQPCAVET
jgi:hypothetical protein